MKTKELWVRIEIVLKLLIKLSGPAHVICSCVLLCPFFTSLFLILMGILEHICGAVGGQSRILRLVQHYCSRPPQMSAFGTFSLLQAPSFLRSKICVAKTSTD